MKYSIWHNIKYLSNYSRAVAILHTDISNFCKPILSPEYSFRKINIDDKNDLNIWCKIVSDAYRDKYYNIDDAVTHFKNHLFLYKIEAYFLTFNKEPVATITIGRYKANNLVGGDARIAVKNDFQNKGLGKVLVLYGFYKLKEQGIKFGESVITIKRTASILLHYKCGFYPSLSKEHTVFQSQRRYLFIRAIIWIRLRFLFIMHMNKLSKSIKRSIKTV